MKRLVFAVALGLSMAAVLIAGETKTSAAKPASDWSLNATIIEACSCPMFCQCYFNGEPAAGPSGGHEGHGGMHFCRFNNAFRVNKGHYGAVKLDGVKFWAAGDLGAEFSDAEMDWAVITFDKTMTDAQREAVGAIVAHLYPVKWKSLTTAVGDISWQGGKSHSRAAIDGGKTAEVVLKAPATANNPAEPMVLKNLKYWGAPRNTGFILMPNEVEAYRAGDKAFEYKGTNGFMITFDIDSKTAPPAVGGM